MKPTSAISIITACIVFLSLTSCVSVEENTKNVSAETHGNASILSPVFPKAVIENPASSKDELRLSLAETLDQSAVPFDDLAAAYSAFPQLQKTGEPVVHILSYEFSTLQKTFVLKGKTREKAYAPDSDLKIFLDALEHSLPEFSFEMKKTPPQSFEITAKYQPPNPGEASGFSTEISDTRKMELSKAIPDLREDAPFLETLANESKNLGLSLDWIKENLPPDNGNDDAGPYRRFQITVSEKGLVKDLLAFLTAFPHLPRKTFLVSGKIERTDLRSGIEIGTGEFTLETYFLAP